MKRDAAFVYDFVRPIHDVLHELAKHKNFGVKTFQAEDEIAAICSTIGTVCCPLQLPLLTVLLWPFSEFWRLPFRVQFPEMCCSAWATLVCMGQPTLCNPFH